MYNLLCWTDKLTIPWAIDLLASNDNVIHSFLPELEHEHVCAPYRFPSIDSNPSKNSPKYICNAKTAGLSVQLKRTFPFTGCGMDCLSGQLLARPVHWITAACENYHRPSSTLTSIASFLPV
jgi:hypothetical protein